MTFLAGFIVSFLAIICFVKIDFNSSINKWILETARFVYYSGHPLLNDDEIFDQIKKRFKGVSSSLLVVLLKIIVFLATIAILVGISSMIISLLRGQEILNFRQDDVLASLFPDYLFQWPFILGTIAPILLVPFISKKRATEKATYSAIDKFLHYVFLGNKNIARFIFKIELFLNKKSLKTNDSSCNIYISGMARAGTTVLMQYLGELKEFESLSYRNLPFLFMPKTWPYLISWRKKAKQKERFHLDGVTHSLNSYEALEEPFFRNNLGANYIKNNTIISYQLNEKIFNRYSAFRRLVARDKIYLAKNNNHLLRAESLHQFDKKHNNKTLTIIPFRNPYEQAKSLLKQHKLLGKLQKVDSFTLDYMDFLVHHEFGLHCKIPVLIEKDVKFILNLDKNSIDYWLQTWHFFYSQALTLFKEKADFCFVCYEDFVSNPKMTLEKLLSKANLSEHLVNAISIKEFKQASTQETHLLDRKYLNLYNQLKLISINNFG